MKNIIKSIAILFLVVFISGCTEVIEIDGKTEIRTNETHTYKAVIVSTEFESMDSYRWKVISDHKDYNLTNETTSEVTFNPHNAGEYTLEVIAKKNRKPFKATIDIEVEEPEIVNGYILPPEPDKTLNNSTLLGIDSNDNGVRDDVEIYVIKRYAKDPEFPKTKTALAMQYAWSAQKILENPTMESSKFEDDAIGCKFYWIRKSTKNLTTLEVMQFGVKHKIYDSEIKDNMYNTRVRIERKFEYNSALSGQIFQGQKNTINMCQTNIDEIGE